MRDGLLSMACHAERGVFPWDHDADRWACGQVATWDNIFPDRHDVMLLGSLPIRPRTILAAKLCVSRISAGHQCARAEFRNGSCSASGDGVGSGIFLGNCSRLIEAYSDSRFGVYLRRSAHDSVASPPHSLPRRWFCLRLSAMLSTRGLLLYSCPRGLSSRALKHHGGIGHRRSGFGILARWPSFWFFGLFSETKLDIFPIASGALARCSLATELDRCVSLARGLLCCFAIYKR